MQKRLLALVATVAMVLSMFAGIALAETQAGVATVKEWGAKVTKNHVSGKVLTVGLYPSTVDEATNPEGTTARWFDAVTLDAPEGYKLHKVVRAGKVLQIHEDGHPTELKFWLDAKDAPYVNAYDVTWVKASADDIVETWTINYEPLLKEAKPRAISLGTTKVITSRPHSGYQLISGSFPGSTADYVVLVKYKDDNGAAQQDGPIVAKGGTFSFYLDTSLLPQDVIVEAYLGNLLVAEGKVEVRYNVTLDPAKLEFVYTGEQQPVPITGKLTNSKGEAAPADLIVTLDDKSNNNYITTKTNAKGEFGYVVLQWLKADKLVLAVGDEDAMVPHVEGEVKAKDATLKISPSPTTHGILGEQTFTVKGESFDAQPTWDFSKLSDTAPSVLYTTDTIATDGKFEATFKWTPTKAGSFVITAKTNTREAKVTLTVNNPASLNWMNVDLLEELQVDDNVIAFGPAGVHLASYDGSTSSTAFVYVVVVDDKEKLDQRKEGAAGTVTISPTKLGDVAIKVTAYKLVDQEYKEVTSKTFTAKVNGLDVDVDVTELTVNKKHTITFVVKDANGVPVNNATIYFDNVIKVDPTKVNIQNGTYVVKDFEPKTLQAVKVLVKGVKDAKATLSLDVVGDKVYAVTADVDTLLQGKGQDVQFTVTRDSVAVMAQRVKWIYEDGTSDEIHPTYLGDGVSKAKITAKKSGALTVRVENFDGTLCGEVELEVVAPKLVFADEDVVNATNYVKTELTFKLVDPRDDSVIKDNLKIKKNDYVSEVQIYDANEGLLADTLFGAEEHKITVLAQVKEDDFKAAAKKDKVPAILLEWNGVSFDAFEVIDATITSDPALIIIGANNNLTLTYADANGAPIVGKTVKAGDVSLGKTDDKGQVIYPVGVVVGPVKVTATTDVDKVLVEHTIKVGYDAEAPKVTYEIVGAKAHVTISDNVRLVRINIDGKDVDFWPGAKYEFTMDLKPGVNKVAVKAQDSSDNVLDEVVEIDYLTDSIVLQGDTVLRKGEYLFVQARQFEDFGAVFGWNQETKTATFTVGDVVVQVTIGSETALVNGEAVKMPAAPFLANDRTYVPVRFISENLGWNVLWQAGDIVTITLP